MVPPPLPPYQSPMMMQQQQQASMEEATATATTSSSLSSSLRLPLAAAYNKANEKATAAASSSSSNKMEITDQKHNNKATSSSMQPSSPSAAEAEAAHSTPRVWEYPLNAPLPNKALLRSLYQTAMNNSCNNNNQQEISDLGLLSMEDVLLPAIAYQEERALKQIQAVVQRDYPAQQQQHAAGGGGVSVVDEVVQARKAVYDATRLAVQACQTNRLQHRLPQQKAREEVWAQERQDLLQKVQEQDAQKQRHQDEIRLQARERRWKEKKDHHPVNQELWREVAYLMTEIHHLEKEERLWKEAAASLLQQEEEEQQQQTAVHNVATTANDGGDDDDDDAMDVDNNNHDNRQKEDATTTTTTISPELAQMLETIDSITISAVRVEQSLQMVADMMQQSDILRSDIYRRHEAERFRGYPGEREPKDLIRLLSQE